MQRRFWVSFISLSIILLAMMGDENFAAAMSLPIRWAPQARIPVYDDLLLEAPHLIADQNRTLHLFNALTIDNQVVIAYRYWTLKQGWTTPIDIIIPPNNALPSRSVDLSVLLDQAGFVHLVFIAGNDKLSNIYYSKAPLINAGQARAWSAPRVIGSQATFAPSEVALRGDGQGKLFVLYAGEAEGNGVYFTQSADGGDSWTETVPIFQTLSEDLWTARFALYIDKQKGVHALWSLVGVRGLSEAIYYTKLEEGQERWNEPIEFVQATGYQADAPALIEYKGELFVSYHNDAPTTIWVRRSSDYGRTWTPPVRLAPNYIGSNGAASYVIDSNNTLHVFFANRTNTSQGAEIHGVWHRVWLGDNWGEVESVVSGPMVVDRIGGSGFDPNGVHAILSQGNTVLLTWITDGAAGENGAWYSYGVLDAPELPVIPLPTLTPTPQPTIIATPTTVLATPTSARTYIWKDEGGDTDLKSFSHNPAEPIWVGIISAVFIVGAILFGHHLYHYYAHTKGV